MQLLNTWYAVALASELKGTSMRVMLHGQPLVLWRDAAGKTSAAADRCPHKGASMAGNCVENGQLRCGYHGWRFDADGTCRNIPGNREGMAIPLRSHLHIYPCQEAHGFIWLWWHQQSDLDWSTVPALPDVQNIPAQGDPAWRCMEGDAVWSAHWVRILEGFLDLTHVPFVHKATFGGAAADQLYPAKEEHGADSLYALINTPRDRHYRSEQGGNWLSRLSRRFRSQAAEQSEEQSFDGTQQVNLWLANVLFIRVIFKDFSIYLCLVPVPMGNGQTRLLWRHFRSFLRSPLADKAALKRIHKFLAEDRQIVESVTPFQPDIDCRSDLLLASDSLSLALRKILRERRDAGTLLLDR